MPELTFKSAGISSREIDLSGPTGVQPVGTPAGVIGTSNRGPAFVPVMLANTADFYARFGYTDGEKFGPIAVVEWLRYTKAVTFTRVLGAGNGKKATTSGDNAGRVENSGFVVGAQQVQDNGKLGHNVYANQGGQGQGRLYFLGALMLQAADATLFTDAGMPSDADIDSSTPRAHPIIRGVIMAASGVVPTLSGSTYQNAGAPSSTAHSAQASNGGGLRGGMTGTVNIGDAKQEFVMLMNGHNGLDGVPLVITASFDIDQANYIGNVLNTDPAQIEQKGHYLYAHWPIHSVQAVITGSGILSPSGSINSGLDVTKYQDAAFLVTSSLSRNQGNSVVPNYENWEYRYKAPKSSWVISQKFGGKAKNLFRLHSRDDGCYACTKVKFSIENIANSQNDTYEYGKFDLVVRDFDDTDSNKIVLEQFRGVSLDPTSDRYAARVIGDSYTYYDFDKKQGAQKLVTKGVHSNKSSYVRIEMNSAVDDAEVDATALPVGFRGPWHLITSGTSHLTTISSGTVGSFSSHVTGANHYQRLGPSQGLGIGQAEVYKRSVVPPVPFREHLKTGESPKEILNKGFYWGVQWEIKKTLTEPNGSTEVDPSIEAWTKWFPDFATSWQTSWVGDNEGTADSLGTTYDADIFHNNMFTLENILVRTGSNNVADAKEWLSASYVRKGGITSNATNKTRALSVSKDFGDLSVRPYCKFNFFWQGGWDGLNIFNRDSHQMLNAAALREMGEAAQGETNASTIASFRKAVDIMSERDDVDIKLLAIPGMRSTSITDYAIDAVEDRFDALYIMDIEERDTENNVVTSSADQKIGVQYTANRLSSRGLDTSFAAAYFPDVIVKDPIVGSNVRVPPSVAVLGAFALNDAVAHPWFAAAGFTRGALESTSEAAVNLSIEQILILYIQQILIR